ncbi:MAG: DUF5011 domain-containing protein [Bacteroidota bacterium]
MKKPLLLLLLLFVPFMFFSCKKNADTTLPVITLVGSADVSVNKGTAYVDAGATALDETDGDITANIQVSNPVDVNTEATYYVTYNVKDKAGNAAVEVKRKVKVFIF